MPFRLAWKRLETGSCSFLIFFSLFSFILAWTFISLQIIEFQIMGLSINDSFYSCVFFFLTGFHFFHLVLGLLLISLFYWSSSFSSLIFLFLIASNLISVNRQNGNCDNRLAQYVRSQRSWTSKPVGDKRNVIEISYVLFSCCVFFLKWKLRKMKFGMSRKRNPTARHQDLKHLSFPLLF